MWKEKLNEYLEWKSVFAPRAAVCYVPHIIAFFNKVGKPIDEVGVCDIARYQTELQKSKSPATVAFVTTAVRDFLGYLQGEGMTKINLKRVRVPKFVSDPYGILSRDEFDVIDSALGESEFWELERKVIHNFLWDTGMRVSEMCALNVSDVDIRERQAIIRTEKNKRRDYIFWSERTNLLLKKYLGVRFCLNDYPPLFIASRSGKRGRLSPRTAERWINDVGKEAGITHRLTPHSYRHGRAHEVLRLGGTVVDIQKILRHSETSPLASFRYLRLNLRERKEGAVKFLR